MVAVIVFSLAALVHLLRLALGWEVTVAGIFVPPWESVVVCLAAAALAFALWRETHK